MATKEELQARIAAAKERKDQIAAEAAGFRELQALEDEADKAERDALDEEAIAAAERELGRQGVKISVVRTALGCIILKRPNATLYRKFCDEGDTKQDTVEGLIRTCRVYPDEAAFSRILRELPGTLASLSNAAGDLAGVQVGEVRGKA